MKKSTIKLLSAIRWFAGVLCIGFAVVFFTSPTLFGITFISSAAIGSVMVYAACGALLGYIVEQEVQRKREVAAMAEECEPLYHNFKDCHDNHCMDPAHFTRH